MIVVRSEKCGGFLIIIIIIFVLTGFWFWNAIEAENYSGGKQLLEVF